MKLEYRFDIAAILLASVLTVISMAPAQAGGRPCSMMGMGDVARSAGDAGGKGSIQGGGVRSLDRGEHSRGGKPGSAVKQRSDTAGAHPSTRAEGRARGGIVLAACWPPPFPGAGDWWCRPR